MQKKNIVISALIALVIFVGGFEAGFFYSRENFTALSAEEVAPALLESSTAASNLDVKTFDAVWRVVEKKFVNVEKLNPKEMFYGAIKGVVSSLGDPHSEFLTPIESEEFLSSLEGSLTGIGAEVGMRDGVITIISPLRGSPAEQAGLLPGDKVFKIDDKIIVDFTLFEAVKEIRGEIGSEVKLTIFRREESQSRDIVIVRDLIEIESVKSKVRDDGIAVVTVAVFSDDTSEEFEKILVELASQDLKGMILDLRFNGGGFLDAAIEMTSKLLEGGDVVRIHERGKSDQVVSVSGSPLLPQIPLVVLINEGSASSSEIVAGALQDNQRAVLIGEKSFGKGTVQELISSFHDGSTLRITVAKWFTPNGRDVNEEGIEPDFRVEMELEDYFSEKDPQFDAAVEFLKTGSVVDGS